MKIIALKGGLGNQLFQYACGRSLELCGKKIVFDTSFYAGNKANIDTARNLKLNNFNIQTKAVFSDRRHPWLDFVNKVLRRLGFSDGGFWQSEKYFKKNESAIRNELTLKSPLTPKAQEISLQIKGAKNCVSLHVRRGDYANDPATNSYWGTCSPEYYSDALKVVASKIGNDLDVFVFSDDIEWVKKNIPIEYRATYVSSSEIPDYEELVLMSTCKHNIIANSSFGWWAAWLNQNPSKIVIAPKQWTRKNDRAFKDIIPKSWTRI